MSIQFQFITSNLKKNTDQLVQNMRPIPLCNKTYTTRDLAKYLNQTTRYATSDYLAFIFNIFKGIEQLLSEGHHVKIDDYGIFGVSLKTKPGLEGKTYYRSDYVEINRVIFSANKLMKSKLNDAKFKKRTTIPKEL